MKIKDWKYEDWKNLERSLVFQGIVILATCIAFVFAHNADKLPSMYATAMIMIVMCVGVPAVIMPQLLWRSIPNIKNVLDKISTAYALIAGVVVIGFLRESYAWMILGTVAAAMVIYVGVFIFMAIHIGIDLMSLFPQRKRKNAGLPKEIQLTIQDGKGMDFVEEKYIPLLQKFGISHYADNAGILQLYKGKYRDDYTLNTGENTFKFAGITFKVNYIKSNLNL